MKVTGRLSLVAFAFSFIAGACYAQAPPDVSQGSNPAGVYLGSNYEFVDTSTGRLNFHIPLLTDHSQRAKVNFTYSISYSGTGAWVDTDCDYVFNTYTCYWEPTSGLPQGPTPILDGALWPAATATGSVQEQNGAEHAIGTVAPSYSTYETIDGSGIQAPSSLSPVTNRDGIQFGINSNQNYDYTITDPNGNFLKFAGNPSGGNLYVPNFFDYGSSWIMTDTVQRSWTYSSATNNLSRCPTAVNAGSTSDWVVPGPTNQNNGTRDFTFCWKTISIQTNFPPDGQAQDEVQYQADASLLVAVVLPDGTSWQFQYDSYGDITELVLPTGGSISYTWNMNNDNCGSGGGLTYLPVVATRTVSDGTNAYEWRYTENSVGTLLTIQSPLGDQTTYSTGTLPCTPVNQIQYYAGSVSPGNLLKTETRTYTNISNPVTYNGILQLPTGGQTQWSNGQTSEVGNCPRFS